MAEARNAKPGGFKYRTFLVVWTTAECISFISSLACNAVKIANHRGSRFQAAEAVVRAVESVTFHVRLQAGCICWTSSTRGIDAIRQRVYETFCFVCEAGNETGPLLCRESTLVLRMRSTQRLFNEQTPPFSYPKFAVWLPRN